MPTPTKDALEFFENMDGDLPKAPPVVEDPPAVVEPPAVKPDDGPKFVREPKKQVTKEDNLAILRKERDEAREQSKKFTETFGDHSPEVIKPILDLLIERADGPITPDLVTDVLNEFKISGKKLSDLQLELQAKEKKVSELDIRHSDEFKKKFQVPYETAINDLVFEFANVTVDGDKIIAPAATDEFKEFLLSNPELGGIKVKGALQQFAKRYKEESGEDAVLPTINSLMTSLRNFSTKRLAMKDAFDNWAVEKKKQQELSQAESEKTREHQEKALRRSRTELASKAFREFPLDDIPFLEEKEIEGMFQTEYAFGEDIRQGKNVPGYDLFLKKGVDAQLWNKYYPELVELRKFKEDVEKGDRSGLPGTNRVEKVKTGERAYGKDHYLE